MAEIKPFRAWRPASGNVEKMAALPYDVMNRQEAKEWASDNPYSFLHVSRAEIDMPDHINPYSQEVYEKAKSNFQYWIDNQVIIQDEKPCFYLYRLVMNDVDQSGIVCLSSIVDYEKDIIKKHEYTRPEKEKDRIDHMQLTGIHSEPIFLAYKQNERLANLLNEIKRDSAPIYDFIASDGILHQLWKIDVAAINEAIATQFAHIGHTYIADGHHRAASSYKVGLAHKNNNPNHQGDEPYNYILTVIFPDNEVSIQDYNRVVKDLNGLSEIDFLAEIKRHFDIINEGPHIYKPSQSGDFGMYMNGRGFLLRLKSEIPIATDPIFSLDTSLLQQYVLEPILGIQDQRTDKRIDFVGGIRGMSELERRVNSGDMAVAFSIFPVSMKQLFNVADSGRVMPPKSTWFEPKLRSGLFIHQFRNDAIPV